MSIVVYTHPYVVFGGDFNHPIEYWLQVGCIAYNTNKSPSDFGITVSVEFSQVDCTLWDDWTMWTDDNKTGIKNFVMFQMDGVHLPGYFDWTWKVGNSSVTSKVEAPFPRISSVWRMAGSRPTRVKGHYHSWQTGGAGAGQIAATVLAEYLQYPPPEISNMSRENVAQLPMYTTTSAVPTLPCRCLPPQPSRAGTAGRT
ncbi:hypothetical protein GY45DRAFT_1375632 [Cubamyces sp. BRFM 1775]|nr:hypothetical protein GY45DRAFT_1375632 [Cubamyces sp. BRFM 1775]